MIRVVEAISDTNIGGAGILLLNRISNMDRGLFDITVMLPENSLLKKRVDALGIKTVEIKGKGDKSFDVTEITRYMSALKKIKPHMINSHGSLASRIAATVVGVPVRIYTRHCVFPLSDIYRYSIIRAVIGAATDMLSHRVIAVAHSAKRDLVVMGVDPRKISVIINGARPLEMPDRKSRESLKRILGISGDDIVVTICARLEKYKDHYCLLRAADILKKRGGNYKFLIIGTGSLENELKRTVHSLGIDNQVIFTGFIGDISPYMGITDVNVNCSVGTETSSLALSEGMSLGVPAVVSDYGGNPYMVKNGINGYVYKKGNAEDLARCIEKMARSKENGEYARMSRESRRRFESELNALCMTRKTEKLYLQLMKRKDRGVKPRSENLLN